MEPLSIISVLIGLVVLGVTILDAFLLVFVVGAGIGLLSYRLAARVWRLALRFHVPDSKRSHAMLRCVGPVLLLMMLAGWLAGLIVGWALIFVPSAFSGDNPVHWSDRLVFAANAVVGRGGNNPQLEVSTDLWELIHTVAGLTGIALLSLGLAYVLPVLGAVAHRRSIAAMIHSLGDSVDEIRELAGRVDRGGQIELHLIALTPEIVNAAERHRSYPVLHYFHSSQVDAALAPAIAKMCLLLRDHFPEADDADASVSRPLGRAIRQLMGALYDMGLDDFARDRLDASFERMEPVPLQVRSDEDDGLPSIEWLKAYVAFDGWNWAAVAAGDSSLDDTSQSRVV